MKLVNKQDENSIFPNLKASYSAQRGRRGIGDSLIHKVWNRMNGFEGKQKLAKGES